MSNWKEKVVVVTGGTSGLGLAIANRFVAAGAQVIVLSRQPSTLADSDSLVSLACDVTDKTNVATVVDAIRTRFGRIDVWVNNVGKSIRTSLSDATADQYQDLLNVNFYSALNCSQIVLRDLEKTSGHLVNIGSLAAKTGWPFVAPYTVSKHALAAYHHQLRLEGPKNIHYLLVCPGPIRRSDTGTRYDDQVANLPKSAARPGAGVKLSGIAPDQIADKILTACQKRKLELVIPGKARFLFGLAQLWPSMGDYVLRKFTSKKTD